MSLSPEGRRRLIRHLGLHTKDSFDAIRGDVSKPMRLALSYGAGPQFVGGIERSHQNWPSQTTLSTNMLHRSLRGEQIYMFELCNQAPAARRSPARLKEAVSWWFARAEARRIIERMMQK